MRINQHSRWNHDFVKNVNAKRKRQPHWLSHFIRSTSDPSKHSTSNHNTYCSFPEHSPLKIAILLMCNFIAGAFKRTSRAVNTDWHDCSVRQHTVACCNSQRESTAADGSGHVYVCSSTLDWIVARPMLRHGKHSDGTRSLEDVFRAPGTYIEFRGTKKITRKYPVTRRDPLNVKWNPLRVGGNTLENVGIVDWIWKLLFGT